LARSSEQQKIMSEPNQHHDDAQPGGARDDVRRDDDAHRDETRRDETRVHDDHHDAELASFEQHLRNDLPRLSDDAMSRIETVVRGELAAHDRAPAPSSAVAGRIGGRLPGWTRWLGVAASVAIVAGLLWYQLSFTAQSFTASPAPPAVRDDFVITVEPATNDAEEPAAAPRPLIDVAAYDALIGRDSVTRR